MTDQEAFEHWWNKHHGLDGYPSCKSTAWDTWQAATAHYEAVMRRAVDAALEMAAMHVEQDQAERIIARAKADD